MNKLCKQNYFWLAHWFCVRMYHLITINWVLYIFYLFLCEYVCLSMHCTSFQRELVFTFGVVQKVVRCVLDWSCHVQVYILRLYLHTFACVYMRTYTCVCVCVCICCIRVCTCMCVRKMCVCVCVCVHVYAVLNELAVLCVQCVIHCKNKWLCVLYICSTIQLYTYLLNAYMHNTYSVQLQCI